ncbi:hypothetical protein EPO17_02775 [Patescibacteria group bacterium]|nr:MAG: hypothetical protein EPO17_02775 [Patescibacteria group bacterium]
MKVRYSGPASKKRSKEIRDELPAFLREPRTLNQVADRFSISGISAAAFLKGVAGISFDPETKTYFIVPAYATQPL